VVPGPIPKEGYYRFRENGNNSMMEMGAKAAAIMEAMIEQRQTEDVADAFMEAYGRGPAWKEAIRKSLSEIDDGQRQPIQSALAQAI
jgi:hypothetical protein